MVAVPPWELKREVIVKSEEETDQKYGCPPMERPFKDQLRFGVINLDKPPGPTSHEVVAWIKRLLLLDKAGHGGTLDPQVTGVLPIVLEDATRVVQALLLSGKEYVCVMKTHREESEEKVKETLKLFEGEIWQRPPLRSSVSRRLRTRTIYRIEYLEGNGRDFLFKTACSAGTYIRKLCYDVGEVLGVGAHMRELRRTRSGPFTEEKLYTMYDIVDAVDLWKQNEDSSALRKLIQPMEAALENLPKVYVRDSAVDALCHGAVLAVPGILRFESGIERGTMVATMTQKGEAVTLSRTLMSGKDMLEAEHGLAAKTLRVLMLRGTYPKNW